MTENSLDRVRHWFGRYLKFGDLDCLKRASEASRRLLSLGLPDSPDEIRLASQSILFHSVETGLSEMEDGDCGADRMCKVNAFITALGGASLISLELVEESHVPVSCKNADCPYHRHLPEVKERGAA